MKRWIFLGAAHKMGHVLGLLHHTACDVGSNDQTLMRESTVEYYNATIPLFVPTSIDRNTLQYDYSYRLENPDMWVE